MAKSNTVKFEVGQLVEFPGASVGARVGLVSRIAKNGAIYVIVLGETQGADQDSEELRVKKADLQLVNGGLARTKSAVHVEAYMRQAIRNTISCAVSSNAKRADDGTYELAPDYIPSPSYLEYCEWEGSKAAQSVMHDFGIDLVKLANLYTGKSKVEVVEATQEIEAIEEIEAAAQEIEAIEDAAQQAAVAPIVEPIQSTFGFPTDESQAQSSADATYALRELTFSVTRHSILTAFIDVALNKDIPGYHHKVASHIKNLMAASFDPVHDSGGYARINTWMMAALELVVKNKNRVVKMLSQPIEAAPIKIDRVTKLGMWIDNMMNREGMQVNDMTSAHDSCYVYDALGKKLKACSFVVVEVTQSAGQGEWSVIPLPAFCKESTSFQEYLTAQSAIARRKQCIDWYRPTEPDLHRYCGIVPILKTGLSMQAMQAAIEDTLASVIGSIKMK